MLYWSSSLHPSSYFCMLLGSSWGVGRPRKPRTQEHVVGLFLHPFFELSTPSSAQEDRRSEEGKLVDLTHSLPNATVVEITVHCQTRLQSKFKGTVDSCFFNRYRGRKYFFFISKFSGDIIISYMKVDAIFCTRIDFTSMLVMSLDFAEIKNIENMSMGMTYRTHFALQLLYFDLFLMKQHIRINPDV